MRGNAICMAVSVNETELKYDAPASSSLPRFEPLAQVAGTERPDAEELEAEYYDTPDLRLIRAGITLRRRRAGHDQGWHLKLPVSADTRREIQLPLGKPGAKVPRELAEQVRVHTRREPLQPVVRMITTRQRLVLLDAAGTSLAEVTADDVRAQRHAGTAGMEPAATSQWSEIEVELTGGDRTLLSAADDLLRRNGLTRSASSAKLARALGIERASQDGGPVLGAASYAGDVVTGYLGKHLDALKTLDPMVRRDEPDAVHQLRVTTRRLRSALQTFGKLIFASDTAHLAAELKWLGTILGAARDAEVLSAHITTSLEQLPAELVIGPVKARVQGYFAPLGAQARSAAKRALDSERYFALLDDLDALASAPQLTAAAGSPGGDALRSPVRRAYRRTRRRMRLALRASPGRSRELALHDARKAAKRARYAAEAVSPAAGRPAVRFATQMKKVQSLLGDHQDCVIARQVERELGMSAHLAGENAFSYGLLYERDVAVGERLQGELRARAAEVETRLVLGFSGREAVQPLVRAALRAAMIPTVNGMMTVGLVQLPGMMTGQILAGASPLVAIRYQIVGMFMLAAATAIGALIFVRLAARSYLTPAHQLRRSLL